MAINAEEVYNTINIVTNSPNPLSKDFTLAVLRLSLQPRAQYHQQTHQPHLMESANEKIQQFLDRALELATGLDLLNPAAYSKDSVALQDPTLGAEMIAQPARHEGLGLR
jgi:3-dehydroquinate dehydratase